MSYLLSLFTFFAANFSLFFKIALTVFSLNFGEVNAFTIGLDANPGPTRPATAPGKPPA